MFIHTIKVSEQKWLWKHQGELCWEVKWSEICSVLSNSLQPHRLSPWNSPGQNTGVDSLSLLQGILPTQESNWGLLCCRRIFYQLSYEGSPCWEGEILCVQGFRRNAPPALGWISVDGEEPWVGSALVAWSPQGITCTHNFQRYCSLNKYFWRPVYAKYCSQHWGCFRECVSKCQRVELVHGGQCRAPGWWWHFSPCLSHHCLLFFLQTAVSLLIWGSSQGCPAHGSSQNQV